MQGRINLIESLIKTLLDENKIPELKNSLNISFSVISSGYYRTYKKSRLVVLVFQNSKLVFVIKFYKSNNENLYHEFKEQKLFYNLYTDLIPKPILCEKINGFQILVESPIDGKLFSRYFQDNVSKTSTKNSLKLILDFNNKLNSGLEPSTFVTLNNEVTSMLDSFSNNYSLEKSDLEFIEQSKLIFLEFFKEKHISQRYSNNDFIQKNFIISNGKPILIDFEFLRKTTMYFFEWFQFFKYASNISNDYIHDIIVSKPENFFFQLALQEFSKYKKNDKFSIACRVIFEIFDFERKMTVFSKGYVIFLKNEMKICIDDLKLRFENKVNFDEISDLSKTEGEFFSNSYTKIIDYKNNNFDEVHLSLKNIIKEKDEIISERENSIEQLNDYIDLIHNSKIWKLMQFLLGHSKN